MSLYKHTCGYTYMLVLFKENTHTCMYIYDGRLINKCYFPSSLLGVQKDYSNKGQDIIVRSFSVSLFFLII